VEIGLENNHFISSKDRKYQALDLSHPVASYVQDIWKSRKDISSNKAQRLTIPNLMNLLQKYKIELINGNFTFTWPCIEINPYNKTK
jgi:two-component SAPR family response regulator